MNISKNILSLGLIAVISGISTAQTYTATAGTNGITDIQSDYSMSTGDGASVSVDVPLEFELPKKVAIAVEPYGGALPVNPMFDGINPYSGTSAPKQLNLTPHATAHGGSYTNITTNNLAVTGGLYANTAVTVTADSTDFIHETDSNSTFKARRMFRIGKTVSTTSGDSIVYAYSYDDNDSSTTVFPVVSNLDESALISEGNKFTWLYSAYAYLDTIEPTDRAGKYTSILTVTVSTL